MNTKKWYSNVWKRCWVFNFGKFGLWRLYITKNMRLKNSQQRDNDQTRGLIKLKERIISQRSELKCEICGTPIQHFKQAQLHHILPYCIFPQLRDEEKNVMICCCDCHKEIHCKNPFLNIKLMKEKAKEFGIDLKEHYKYYGD